MKKRGSTHRALAGATGFACFWMAACVICATAPVLAAQMSPAEAPSLEEITVTAQRRSESLQTVPIAITAVSAADIERTGVHELGTLATRVPGLTFSPFAAGQNIVSLRGVSSNDDGAGTDNSVAVFVDDVYLGRVSNINPEMFDVDRVEVLRGPQGTLYGHRCQCGSRQLQSPQFLRFDHGPDLESLGGQARWLHARSRRVGR